MKNLACEMKLDYTYNDQFFEFESICSSFQAQQVLSAIWEKDIQLRERFKILLVNREHKLLGYSEISIGGTAATVVDLKFILSTACLANASGVFLAHNHPSGRMLPSNQDRSLTERIQEALKLVDVTLLDHIILSYDNRYYSFADSGIL